MILQSWNLYKQKNTFICDFWMTHTYISKDKWKLNTIIKNHPIAHVTFLFSFEIQYLLVYLIFEERMFLSFTRDRNNCRWSVKIREKKSSEDKFDYRERTVEMNKVLISALKPLGFLGAVTTMTTTLLRNRNYCITDKQFFHRADYISCIFYSASLYHTFTMTNM